MSWYWLRIFYSAWSKNLLNKPWYCKFYLDWFEPPIHRIGRSFFRTIGISISEKSAHLEHFLITANIWYWFRAKIISIFKLARKYQDEVRGYLPYHPFPSRSVKIYIFSCFWQTAHWCQNSKHSSSLIQFIS